ncbi:MAG TPA: hypothetical protein ENI37_01765 [Chloroflexi bacterium]|nr:hypothetical protein [Chloroflexota bacterium]
MDRFSGIGLLTGGTGCQPVLQAGRQMDRFSGIGLPTGGTGCQPVLLWETGERAARLPGERWG